MKQKKAAVLRKFGLELVGNVPWGTHLCQFYETKEDLIAILVPYFTEGLRNNEFCMWVTSPPLEAEEAKQALKKSVPELDQYIQKGQIEILPYTEWYLLGGSFNSDRVLRDWTKKEKAALDLGFDGLRLTGNTFWLERKGWKAFTDYEEQINNTIGRHKMIAVCTYSLDKCNANEVIDVVKNHQFALIKRSGKWELIESSETKKVQRALLRSEKKFSVLYSSMIEGVAFHDVVYDSSGKAVDYVITDVNPSFEKITGLPKKQVIDKRASELYGTGEPPYLDVYAKVASSGKPASFETYFQPMQKQFSISVFSPSKGKFTTVFHDITQHRQAAEELKHLNTVLNAMRNVSQLMAREKDQDKLLKGVCDKLIENLEYHNVWIALFDKAGNFLSVTECGLGNDSLSLVKLFKSGKLPECALKALRKSGVVVTKDPCIVCSDCPLAKKYEGRGALSVRLEHDGFVYGLLTASTAPSSTQSKEEQYLFEELANDIAFTLHNIEQEKYRKKAEEALKESEEKYRQIIETTEEGIWMSDPSGRTIFANQKMANMIGYARREIIGRIGADFLMKGQEEAAVQTREELGKGRRIQREYQFCCKNGAVLWTLANASPIFDDQGRHVANLFMHTDITDRKKAEKALSERENDLNRAQTVAKTGSWRLNVRHNKLVWSDEAYRIFGISIGTPLTYETFLGAVHPDDKEYVDQKWKEALRGASYDVEHRILVNGKVKWVRERAELELGKDGTLSGGFGTVQDITERKEMQNKLENYSKNLEKLVEERTKKLELSALYARSLIEASLDPLVTIDVGGKITDVNSATELATGCSRKQLIGSDFSDYFTESEKARIGYKTVFAEGFVKDYPLAIRHKSGKTTDVLYNASIYRNAQGEIQGIFAAARDITELKKAEEKAQESAKKLKDAERLAAIGTTAGMVGHDIRNPLQSIISDVYLAKMDSASLPDSEEKEGLRESLEAIEKQTEYINKIVLDLQDFAKPLNPHAEVTDIELIINELLMRNGVPQNIQTDAKVDADAKTMMADSAFMKRILGNLATNAVQAMPNGGKLTLRAYREAGDIVITVEDTGVGIPEEAKPKLFQPLFTTKSKGQGFGLSVVKRLTEALNGTITFESQEGKGTKFTLRFPAAPNNCRP